MDIQASDVAKVLGKDLYGSDLEIKFPLPVSDLKSGALSFAKKFSHSIVDAANSVKDCLLIVHPDYKGRLACPHILSEAPRLDYMRAIEHFFYHDDESRDEIFESSVAQTALLGADVHVGYGCRIGRDVVVGEGTRIGHNVVILGRTRIGKNCYIKSGSVIGEEGFGFEYDEEGVPVHFPHIGRIEIGDNVFIGSNSTVELAAIDVTKIENDVKIDDLVQIGHNCVVGKSTLIMAGVILCGGAVIGERCWIAPHSVIKEKLKIGDGAMTGLSSVVLKDVASGMIVVGNPARELRKR